MAGKKSGKIGLNIATQDCYNICICTVCKCTVYALLMKYKRAYYVAYRIHKVEALEFNRHDERRQYLMRFAI